MKRCRQRNAEKPDTSVEIQGDVAGTSLDPSLGH